jgi:hypothetical protein
MNLETGKNCERIAALVFILGFVALEFVACKLGWS